MHDAARISATAELLEQCEQSWQKLRPLPADIIINRYFKERRFIGSKDRGAIAALVYLIIRNYATLTWHTQQHDIDGARALVIAALLLIEKKSFPDLQKLFNGEKFSPALLNASESAFAKALAGKDLLHEKMPDHVRYNYPLWLEKEIQSSLGEEWRKELVTLAKEAPVDLRVNTLLTTRDTLLAALQKEGFAVEATTLSPLGIRMQTRAPVFTSECFKKGWFEMQDEGSQLVSLMLNAKPGQKIIDFCAGAGGKTLAIAAQMKNKGRIFAWDTSEKRLAQMKERLKRAKVDNVQMHLLESERDPFIKRHKDSADAVIVDAPCSGSGTWRRNPDLKWRFHEKDLQEIMQIQKNILDSAARTVKPSGYLLYVTCSMFKCENETQVATFLSQQQNFRVVTTGDLCSNFNDRKKTQGGALRLTPLQDGTDGFFASLMQRSE
jgi:16S rRNA (cytosine967-C5)-methyltransferase